MPLGRSIKSQTTILVIHNKLLNSPHNSTLQDIIQAWFQSIEYLSNKPAQAANIISKRLKISSEDVLKSYEGLKLPNKHENQKMMQGKNPNIQKLLNKLNKTMLEHQILYKPMPVTNLYTDYYLKP